MRSAKPFASGRCRLRLFGIPALGKIEEQAGQLADLVVSPQQLVVRRSRAIPATRQLHRIGQQVAQRLGRQVDEPDGGKDANNQDDRDQIHLAPDRSLNFQRNQTRVHANMNGARNAGQDRAADFYEISHAGQIAFHGLGTRRVSEPNLVGNAGNKGVGQQLACFVRDVDVADALNFDELVDERLQGRQIPIQENVHARIGDSLGNVLAVALVLLRQMCIDRVDTQDGG